MPLLSSSTGGLTIGVDESSQVFTCDRGLLHVYISGDASTSTLTLMARRTATGTFTEYLVDDATGTPAVQQFTITEVPADSTYHRVYLEHGYYFQFVADGSGTPAWVVDVNGTNVRILE